MKVGYKQRNKSDFWNKTNKVKRFNRIRTSRFVCIPAEWVRELNLDEYVLLTIDQVNRTIIVKGLPKDEEFTLPRRQAKELSEGWIDDEKSDSEPDSGESRIY